MPVSWRRRRGTQEQNELFGRRRDGDCSTSCRTRQGSPAGTSLTRSGCFCLGFRILEQNGSARIYEWHVKSINSNGKLIRTPRQGWKTPTKEWEPQREAKNGDLLGMGGSCQRSGTPAGSPKRRPAGVGGLLSEVKNPSGKPKTATCWGWGAPARGQEPQREAKNGDLLGLGDSCQRSRTPVGSQKRRPAGVGGLLSKVKNPSGKPKTATCWGWGAPVKGQEPQREVQTTIFREPCSSINVSQNGVFIREANNKYRLLKAARSRSAPRSGA